MKHTLKTLGLNFKEAQAGRTWLLLPEEARSIKLAEEWPLPDSLADLRTLSSIPIPNRRRDVGVTYLRRARLEWQRAMEAKGRSAEDIEIAAEEARARNAEFEKHLSALEERAAKSVEHVRQKAQEAAASMESLFELGRAGLEGQMTAHIQGTGWHGETINAAAFRECFNMVARTVKGLGLPSEEKSKARAAIMEEVAASLRGTKPVGEKESEPN